MQLIQKNLQTYERTPNNPMLFYRAYSLALQYYKFELKKEVDEKKLQRVNKLLRIYYYDSLKKAIQSTPRLEGEKLVEWNPRIRNKYMEFRKRAFMLLQTQIRQDYALVLEVISIDITEDEGRSSKLKDKPNIWMVRYDEY